MKFKLNDRVKVIKNGSHGQNIGDTGHIIDLDGKSYIVRMDKDNDYWWFHEDEIDYDNIKVGDIVEIDTKATIGDITENDWHGCQCSTLDFIRDFSNEGLTFRVTSKYDNSLKLDDNIGPININIFKKVKVDVVKEMTKDEIEQELGYKIKII